MFCKPSKAIILIVILSGIFIMKSDAAENMIPNYPAMAEAFQKGEINTVEYAKLVVNGILHREALDESWLTERITRDVCLSMMVKELREIGARNAEVSSILGELNVRQDMQDTIQSPEGFFSVHFDTVGYHAVYEPDVDVDPADGIPDFVNRCAEALDYAWHIEIDTLGFDPPSSDYGIGGSDNYDVYMFDNGWWGMEFADGPAPDYPERPRAWYSHIFINPTFNFSDIQHDSCRIPALRITTAHEFHHALQDIYDYMELKSAMEQTSVWMENVVWDETYCCAAYWVLMHEFLNNPQKYFYYGQSGSRFHYGACVWPFYLEHNFGRDIMRQVWQECIPIDVNSITAYEIALQNHGTSHVEELPEFRVWNYFTGDRDDGNHYEEGSYWPGDTLRIMAEHTTYPVLNAMPTAAQRPQGYACNYIEFSTLDDIDHLRINFADQSTDVNDWSVKFILWDEESSAYASMPISNEAGEVVIYPDDASKIIMIPNKLNNTYQSSHNYSYSVYANECLLSGEMVGGELVLTWIPRDGASSYWIYGADNCPDFEPGGSPGFEHRIAVLGSGATTWSSANGIGDADHNWTYLVRAVGILGQELLQSNRIGEFDFETEIIP